LIIQGTKQVRTLIQL